MVASGGDAVDLIETARTSIWNADDVRVEVHAVDITVATNAGTATLDYNTDFSSGEVFAIAAGNEAGDFFVSSAGAAQATVEAANTATADGTVTAFVLVVGPE